MWHGKRLSKRMKRWAPSNLQIKIKVMQNLFVSNLIYKAFNRYIWNHLPAKGQCRWWRIVLWDRIRTTCGIRYWSQRSELWTGPKNKKNKQISLLPRKNSSYSPFFRYELSFQIRQLSAEKCSYLFVFIWIRNTTTDKTCTWIILKYQNCKHQH